MEEYMIESNLTEQIMGGAIEVHKHWGSSLYEEIYQRSLCHEQEPVRKGMLEALGNDNVQQPTLKSNFQGKTSVGHHGIPCCCRVLR